MTSLKIRKMHTLLKKTETGPPSEPRTFEHVHSSQAFQTGDWICLQNCHVATSWLSKLEQIVEDLSSNKKVHPDFRLWLTAMPSDKFPVPVLQNGIKLTTEPPKGIRANLVKTYSDVSSKDFKACQNCPTEWRQLLFAVSFFHSAVLQRRKFGPLGWNIKYDFSPSDLECSLSTVKLYLEEGQQIPWTALRYLIGEIHYGGRVTDEWDRVCIQSILESYVNPQVLQPGHAFSSSGEYRSPLGETLQEHKEHMTKMPAWEDPDVFGMHSNAENALQLQETRKLIDAVVTLQPCLSSSGSGDSIENTILTSAETLLQSLKPALSKADGLPGLFEKNEKGQLNSLSVVLEQEMDRFNRLSRALAFQLF